VVNDQLDSVIGDGSTTHLAPAMRCVANLGFDANVDVAFVRCISSSSAVFVQRNFPWFPIHNRGRLASSYDKPFFQIAFTAIQVGLIFGPESLLLEFLPNLTSGNSFGETLHHFNNSQVNSSRFAFRH
jgi:hypothetical protein